MTNEYKFTQTLTISQYNVIIRAAFARIDGYKRNNIKNKLYYIQREVELIKHCKVFIRYVQSQLN